MVVKNSNILEKIIEENDDFQQRIPNPTVKGYVAAISEIFQLDDILHELERMVENERG